MVIYEFKFIYPYIVGMRRYMRLSSVSVNIYIHTYLLSHNITYKLYCFYRRMIHYKHIEHTNYIKSSSVFIKSSSVLCGLLYGLCSLYGICSLLGYYIDTIKVSSLNNSNNTYYIYTNII